MQDRTLPTRVLSGWIFLSRSYGIYDHRSHTVLSAYHDEDNEYIGRGKSETSRCYDDGCICLFFHLDWIDVLTSWYAKIGVSDRVFSETYPRRVS